MIFTDTKSQDLYNLFKEGQRPSNEASYREAMVKILGDLEHLFRIEMARAFLPCAPEYLLTTPRGVQSQLPSLSVFTIQLLGKDDPNQEDPEIYIDRWRSYITSYTSVSSLGKAPSAIDRFATLGDCYEGLCRIEDQASVPSKVFLP